MARPRNPSELQATAATVAARAATFERDCLDVLARLRDWSNGGSGGGGPKPKNQVSDPTGTEALGRDQFAQERRLLALELEKAWRAMCEIERIRRFVMSPPPEKEPSHRGLQRCCNPHGCDEWATKAGRCESCYKYLRRNDRDRRVDAAL